MLGDRLDDERVHVEAEPRGEHRGAQHPHRILDEADARIADRSNRAALEIAEAADVVDHRSRRRCRRRAR